MDFLYQIVKFDTQHGILSRIFKPKNAKKYEKMAKNGRRFVVSNFDREVKAKQFEQILEKIARKGAVNENV